MLCFVITITILSNVVSNGNIVTSLDILPILVKYAMSVSWYL